MGRPVWKLESSSHTKFFFYSPNKWWDVGDNYTIAIANINSPKSGLSEIPSHGWKVGVNDTLGHRFKSDNCERKWFK